MSWGSPVEHRGTVYRSKAEAAWAIYFECADIPFIYEPCKFELPETASAKTANYIPDFVLLDKAVVLEIKNGWMNDRDISKWQRFSEAYGKACHFYVLDGYPWLHNMAYASDDSRYLVEVEVAYKARALYNEVELKPVRNEDMEGKFRKLPVVSVGNLSELMKNED